MSPIPGCSGTFRRVFSAHCDAPGGAGRPVTAVALVPILPGFLQQRCTVAHRGRPVTAADLPPFPPAFAPDAGVDARAHRLERLSGPPLAASSLAWRAVAGGSSYCTFVGSSRLDGFGTYQPRHSQQRRRPPLPSVGVIHRRSHVANTAASSAWNYDRVDLLTAARWVSDWPPPKLVCHSRQ